jgi:hypothetical protein
MLTANQFLRSLRATLCLAGVCLLLSVAGAAQESVASTPPTLLSMPTAVWPPSASTYLGNIVSVNVDVNEKGRVASILSVDGPGNVCPGANSPEITKLRDAAKGVALKAKFKPALAAGKPVASTAFIEVIFPDPPKAKLMKADAMVVRGAVSSNVKTVQGELTTNQDKLAMRETPMREVEGTAVKSTADRVDVAVPPDATKTLPSAMPKTVSGGVLNGKAMSLAKPTYPPAAKAVRATGSVNVQVLIGEDGSMLSATAVSGHPMLRSASRIAACSSRFSPTLLMGDPVKVSGVITYNFVP